MGCCNITNVSKSANNNEKSIDNFSGIKVSFDKINEMGSSSQHRISIADYYFDFLKNLNYQSKLDLISKLSQSLKDEEMIKESTLESLFGAYKSDESADEIISTLRSSRTFNRNTESI